MQMNNGIGERYHCFRCNRNWGDGADISSYGLCIECLGKYINERKVSKGFDACFGKLNQGGVCDSCKYRKFCEEYYGKG